MRLYCLQESLGTAAAAAAGGASSSGNQVTACTGCIVQSWMLWLQCNALGLEMQWHEHCHGMTAELAALAARAYAALAAMA